MKPRIKILFNEPRYRIIYEFKIVDVVTRWDWNVDRLIMFASSAINQ